MLKATSICQQQQEQQKAKLRQQTQQQQRLHYDTSLTKKKYNQRIVSDRKATVNLASIVLAFAVCWIPYFVIFVVWALIIAVFAAGWFSISLKALKLQLEAVAANKTKLAEARIAAKETTAKADERLAEMTALHASASKLFWRNEKTWIG